MALILRDEVIELIPLQMNFIVREGMDLEPMFIISSQNNIIK